MTCRCIERNHGTLDKFIGDATMAFWGAPLPEKDPAYLAARAAMEMMREADILSQKLQQQELQIGIGLNFGSAVVGNMGFERRMDYTVIGDTVNMASRLEGIARPGCIYVSRNLVEAIEKGGHKVRYHSLGLQSMRGKEELFEVLELVSLE